MAYTNKTLIEDYLNTTIPSSKTTLLNTLIAAVKLWIDKYVGRTFEGGSATRYYDGSGNDTLLVDPFTGTPTIEILDSSGNTISTFGTSDYILYPLNTTVKDTIILTSNAPYTRWSGYNKRVKVIANWGHSTTVPEDIQLVSTMLVSGLYNSGSSDGIVQSESLGDYSVTYKTVGEQANTMGVMGILDLYRELDV